MEQVTFTQQPRQKQSLVLLSALSQKVVLLQRLAQNPGEPYRSAWLATAITSYIIYLNSVLATHQNDAEVVCNAAQLKDELQQALLTFQQCSRS